MPRCVVIIFWYCQLTARANAQIPPAMKLLTMGDSITYGYSPAGSPGGYRTILDEDLTGFCITVRMMIGSNNLALEYGPPEFRWL